MEVDKWFGRFYSFTASKLLGLVIGSQAGPLHSRNTTTQAGLKPDLLIYLYFCKWLHSFWPAK